MLVTLSERKLSERIREMENLSDSIEEINDRISHHAQKLFNYIAEFGVRMVGMVSQSGGLGTFQFALAPIWDEESRALRIQGLQLMAPNSCTVEVGDLPGLVPQSIVRTMLEDEFHTYSHELAKVLPTDIAPTLERIAQRAMKAPSSADFGDASMSEAYFQDWLRRSGKKDPSLARRERDAAEQQELARIAAERDLAYERFRNGE